MNPFLRLLPSSLAVLALLPGAAAPPAAASCSQLVTSPTTLPAGDLSFEGCDVVVSGTTLTVGGAHVFASLLVTNGGTVTCAARDSITLSVTGDLTVQAGSRIRADGLGHTIGTGPGAGGSGNPASGGSHGGHGGSDRPAGGPTYGDALSPSRLGSGGGSHSVSQANGGGVVRLAVGGTLRIDGAISVNADSASTSIAGSSPGGGAGGGVNLLAGVLAGSGRIEARGGKGLNNGGGGGGGRIAIETGADAFSGVLSAAGGASAIAHRGGAAGTIWRHTIGQPAGEWRADNEGQVVRARTDLVDTNTVIAGAMRVEGAAVVGVRRGVGLVLTVQGPLTVAAGAAIAVDGCGRSIGQGPGAGRAGGPAGGGLGGRGGGPNRTGGATYDDLFAPTALGSGGGLWGASTSDGGGALRLAVSGHLQLDGELRARGDSATTALPNYFPGGGSGGSLWITCPTLAGAGRIDATGGPGLGASGAGGGGGRIALVGESSGFLGEITAAGAPATTAALAGAAGTVWIDTPSGPDELRIDNRGVAAIARTELADSVVAMTGVLRVTGSATLGGRAGRAQVISVMGDASVAAGSAISVDGDGHVLGEGTGAGWRGTPAGGGSHAGRGGRSGAGGLTYGDVFAPVMLGSGGGVSGVSAGAGGGALRLVVSGDLLLDGEIRACGDTASTLTPTYAPGGGAGGSVWITTDSFSGSGRIDASGGRGYGTGGAGGGGRISVGYGSRTFHGGFRAEGGTAALAVQTGAAGTVWLDAPGATDDEMWIDNGGRSALVRTELPDSELVITGSLHVRGRSVLSTYRQQPFRLTITHDAWVETGSAISVDGCGQILGAGAGHGIGGTPSGGGGYGGRGGGGSGSGSGGPTYGSPSNPLDLGSGGGISGVSTGAGGGALQLDVAGEMRIDGLLSARGDSGATVTPGYAPGGGSGGSLRISAGSIAGSGIVDAGGGKGLNGGGGGGGGGGRVALFTTCWSGFSPAQIRVQGGAGGGLPAEPGTVFPEFEIGVAAGPVAWSGAVRLLRAPASLAPGGEEGDSAFVTRERGRLRLAPADSLVVDLAEPGVYAAGVPGTPAELPALTWLDGHLLHFDPVGTANGTAAGSVTFDTNILGVIHTDAGLDASDPLLHAPGLDVATGFGGRGAELTAGAEGDTLEITEDRRTLRFAIRTPGGLDQVRILTALPVVTCGAVTSAPHVPAVNGSLLALLPPYPNPGRGPVTFRFAIAQPGRVRVTVHDVAGRVLARVLDEELPAGWHLVRWDPAQVHGFAPGIHFARIEAGRSSRTARITLTR